MKFPSCSINRWAIIHFFLYTYLGFVFPNNPIRWFFIGVLFEIAEDYLDMDEDTKLYDCVKSKGFWCNGFSKNYINMNPTDPWVNLMGYLVGQTLRTSS